MAVRSLRPRLIALPACIFLLAMIVGPFTVRVLTTATPAQRENGALGVGPASWVDDLSPLASGDWNYHRAAHLLERAGFGATPEEVARVAAMSPQQAVDELVNYESIGDRGQPSFDESGIWDVGMDPFPPSRACRSRRRRSRD